MLLYGANHYVSRWVEEQIELPPLAFGQDAKAIGVTDGKNLICGVVYIRYSTIGIGSMEMSIASVDKRWATRHNLRAFFEYPFTQLGLGRVSAHCDATAEGVRMFLERLGFKQEGLHRKAHHSGRDALSFAMLKPECRWL